MITTCATAVTAALMLSALLSIHSVVAATRENIECNKVGSITVSFTKLCLCEPCHLCHFTLTDGCQLIQGDNIDFSDGSELEIEQVELKPDAWFLSDEEMTSSRSGNTRTDLALWSEKNLVTTFAASKEYFDAVYADIEAAHTPDTIYVTGWSFDDVPLTPDADAANVNNTKLVKTLSRAISRGADFHAIGWSNVFEIDQNVAIATAINALPAPSVGTCRFIFDDRVPGMSSTHHQKSVIVKRLKGIIAYVGGVDLTSGRWDTLAHDRSNFRFETGVEKEENLGWMDAHLRIDGLAAVDVAQNFLSRWNDNETPLQDDVDELLPFKNPEYSSLPPLNEVDPLVVRKHGHHNVQIVRTLNCKGNHYGSFAPHGEVSIYYARLKALRLAKNYIYIEDQYFLRVPELLEILLQVLPGLQRLIVVVQRPQSTAQVSGYDKYQFQMIAPLQAAFPNKVQVYTTKKDRAIYIHSKLVIIDDVYLTMGSANWNSRSMTTDTEIAAIVVDDKHVSAKDNPDGVRVAVLARDYRIRKFMELTGKSYDELNGMSFVDAANALDGAAASPDTIIERYVNAKDASFAMFTDDVQDLVDPFVMC